MPREPSDISTTNERLILDEFEDHSREIGLLFTNLEQQLITKFPNIEFQYIPNKVAAVSIEIYLSHQFHPDKKGERVRIRVAVKKFINGWRPILELVPIDPKKPAPSGAVRMFVADIIDEINGIE